MKINPLFSSIALASSLLASALFWSTGCRTTPIQRDLMSDDLTAGERPIAMRGEGNFAGGKLTAFATISRGFDRGSKGPARERRAGRKNDDNYPFADTYNVGYGDSEEQQKEAMEEYIRMAKAQRAAGSPMPPVTLRVNLENKGTEPITVEVTDVNSDLGNFAVRPPKLTIAPGQVGSLEPMISQLGVTADEIPLQIAVRVGGKKESQVITVKSLLLAPAKK